MFPRNHYYFFSSLKKKIQVKMTQNVPFIVAQHLNTVKHNTSAIRGVVQLSCGSKLSKQRQAIPAICESDVRGLA